MWHVICGTICVVGMISYAFMGCAESDKTLRINENSDSICNADCHCGFVRYSPVCGTDGFTYTSACHAGCKISSTQNKTKAFGECSCVRTENVQPLTTFSWALDASNSKSASSGPCAVNCQKELFTFLALMCFLKFIGATGRISNFLISIRCIDEKDKTVSIGVSSTLVHLFALIPSPILFGFILDK